MSTETLEYLEQVLEGLRARYASGDKSVEVKLRAVAARVDQLKLHKDLGKPPATSASIGKQFARILKRRRSCCR